MYLALKYAHIVGATILFGTGLGIAFFLFAAVRSRDVALIARTLRAVVVADFVFTAPAVVTQLATGLLLVREAGYAFGETWIWGGLALYALVGACWLPVVAIQIRLGRIAEAAVRDGSGLPAEFQRLYRVWFALGWPAFVGVLAILALMVWKP
jgi:uncharacterized membrane protein